MYVYKKASLYGDRAVFAAVLAAEETNHYIYFKSDLSLLVSTSNKALSSSVTQSFLELWYNIAVCSKILSLGKH